MTKNTGQYRLPLLARLAYWLLQKLTRLTVEGLGNLPKQGGVLAFNHCAFADGPLLWIVTRRPTVFMATKGTFRIPLLNRQMRKLQFIPVDRSAKRTKQTATTVLTMAHEAVEQGLLVAMSPEGGINRRRLKPGVARLAAKGCVIIPTIITGAAGVWPASGWRKFVPMPWRRVHITFHPPLAPALTEAEVLSELAKLFQKT